MALPALENWLSTVSSVTVTSIDVDIPAGVQNGELLFLSIGADLNGGNPASFNDIVGWSKEFAVGNTNADAPIAFFWRIADGTEGSVVTATFTSSVRVIAYCGRVSNPAPVNPVDVFSTTISNTYNPVPSTTTTVDDCLILSSTAFDSATGDPFTTATAGWSILDSRASNSGQTGICSYLATKEQVTAGATGDLTLTIAGANNGSSRYQLAIAGGDGGGGGVTVDVDFSLNKPVFASSINNTAQSNISLISFSDNKPVFAGAIQNEIITNASMINFSSGKAVFNASVLNDYVSNNSSVNFSGKKPAFSVGINNSAGNNISSANFFTNKPIFTALIDNSAGSNLSNVQLASKKPVFTSSIINNLSPNLSLVSFSVNSNVFSGNVQNGEIVVKFNQETNFTQNSYSTNYTQNSFSTNYTQPYLSTNYKQG